MKVTPEDAKLLEDPVSLLTYGSVLDQELGEVVQYDPHRITHNLQETVLSYASDPPMTDDGYTRWLVLLAGRQNGKSLISTLAFMTKAMYREAWRHMTIADTKERADTLHERVMLCYEHWPEDIRTDQQTSTEIRALTLDNHSRMTVHSAETKAVGVGRGVESLVWSEVPLASHAGKQWSLIQPAMINKRYSMVVLESTPYPLGEPSAIWWMNRFNDARKGKGRDIAAFFPFWDSKLCRRAWPSGSSLTSDEENLLLQYGHLGLDVENLAFRRLSMDSDEEISKFPELFGVFYPFDPVTCWQSGVKSVIPGHALARIKQPGEPEPEGLVKFRPPRPGAKYIMGVDPAGFGLRDHAAFQVFEIWDDHIDQVAVYGNVVDPNTFASIAFDVGIEYNRATIACELNGVGVGFIQAIQLMRYPHIYHDHNFRPGVWKSSHDEYVTILVEELLRGMSVIGEDTIMQLKSYQSDKAREKPPKTELISGTDEGSGRRPRHHWDKVSAAMVACVAVRSLPRPRRPSEEPTTNVIPFSQMTWAERTRYARVQQIIESGPDKFRKTQYKRKRR